MSATETFDLQQVRDGVCACVQVGANGPDSHRCWSEDTTVRCFGLKSHCLQCVQTCAVFFTWQQCNAPAGAYRAWETISFLRRPTPTFISPDLWPPKSVRFLPTWEQNIGRNSAAGLQSLWRRWTEAALDQYLASFWTKCHQWRSWWLVQTSLCSYSCKRGKFWAFYLTPYNTYSKTSLTRTSGDRAQGRLC